ncbi:hypothetical protein, partial [Desulfofundulus thermosubterraneus]
KSMAKAKKQKKKKERSLLEKGATITYRCLQCNVEEEIPEEVVQYFDLVDPGDPTMPPRFACEKCGGEMHPKEPWQNSLEDIF